MKQKERRRHKRCEEDAKIVYSFLNRTEKHAAIARNYNRFGMYFESDRPLSPGTSIVIRAMEWNTADNFGRGSFEIRPVANNSKNPQRTSEICRELKTLVISEVTRCEPSKNPKRERYGIGVRYVNPAV
jgi:hypothetical protein